MPLTAPPPAVLHAPTGWRTVECISDLHLQASEPATVAAWQHYMATTTADAVFMLGDLFEVWVGDDALDTPPGAPPSFAATCAATCRATAQRCALYFMHGNRDFLAGSRFAAQCQLTLLADPTVLVFGGQRWLLSHGDALCVDDTAYQQFRAMVRQPAWQSAFLTRPLAEREALARGMRDSSEQHKRATTVYADVDTPAALQWLQAANAPTLVHGHTHRPGQHTLDGAGHQRVVLSDWDLAATPPRAEVLRLDAQGLHRVPLA
ncbi:MAG TPA: UDP-2,3-diacylglucosamine diphosphatase [Burkholderiaceae bacterium]